MRAHGTVSTLTSKTTTGARPLSARLTGVVGWTLLACGTGVMLYLVYALLLTIVVADRAQRDLRTQRERQVAGGAPSHAPGRPTQTLTTCNPRLSAARA